MVFALDEGILDPGRSDPMNTMTYKGYIGQVTLDEEAAVFHGQVMNTRDVITFQGRTVRELRKALKDSVEDYLAFCAERGEDPDKPLSGKFVVRISPELHRKVTIAAVREGKSLNKWVAERLERPFIKPGS
jgi:predicted HicB family RNase H-like nuclease